MNSAMEGILPKSPASQQTIVEQVVTNSKSPPTNSLQPMQPANNRGQVVGPPQQTPMQQNNEPPQPVVVQTSVAQQTQDNGNPGVVVRKPEGTGNGMMTQEIMSDHELLSYINAGCFDPQGAFLM